MRGSLMVDEDSTLLACMVTKWNCASLNLVETFASPLPFHKKN